MAQTLEVFIKSGELGGGGGGKKKVIGIEVSM